MGTVGGGIEILLVEDNQADARLVSEMLSESPGQFELIWVERLSVACHHLLDRTVDCVLLDMGLPDASGLEGVERIRQTAPDVPVVVFTGVDDEDMALEALGHGAQDYLVKGTVDGQALARVIRHALRRHEIHSGVADSPTQDRLLVDLRRAVDSSELAVNAVDREGNVILWNQATEKMFGWTFEEVRGRRAPHVLDAALEHEFSELLQALLEGQQASAFETTRRKKDGTLIPVSLSATGLRGADGAMVGVLCFITDITERKKAEAALRQSEELHRGFLERIPVGVTRSNAAGDFLQANPAMARMLRYPDVETLLATRAPEVYADPRDRKPIVDAIDKEGVFHGEVRLRCWDGTLIRASVVGRAVHGTKGEVVYLEGVWQQLPDDPSNSSPSP